MSPIDPTQRTQRARHSQHTGRSRRVRLGLGACLAVGSALLAAPPAAATPTLTPTIRIPGAPALGGLGGRVPRWIPPVIPMIVTRYMKLPKTQWGAGHRGIDLRVIPGEPILAPAAGILVQGGLIGGEGYLSVQAGTVRYTFTPVAPLPEEEWLLPGEPVLPGEPLAMAVGFGHKGCFAACVHFGVIGPTGYLDPMIFYKRHEARLITPH